MSKKIFIKKCENKIYGWDTDNNLTLFENNNIEKTIGKIKFDYDFCVKDEKLFIIKERSLYADNRKKELGMPFPIKLKIIDDAIYILDQERATLIKFDSSFNIMESIGQKGLKEFEDSSSVFLLFPIDFDVQGESIAIIDTGNRRTIVIDEDNLIKRTYPIIGKKVRFLDKHNIIILFGEEIYKVNLTNNEIKRTLYKDIIDFEVINKEELFILRED